MNEKVKLFDEFERVDAEPAKYQESLYDALNRLSWNDTTTIRLTLEEWFSVYPEQNKKDFLRRFRSNKDTDHQGAFFELFLFTLLVKLGYEITVNPLTASGTPDFFAKTTSGEQFYLEATIVHPKTFRDSPTEKALFDELNKLNCPDFTLSIRTRGILNTTPKMSHIMRDIQAWIDSLDYEKIRTIQTLNHRLPDYKLNYTEWTLIIEALPRSPEKRGTEPHRPIGIGPMRVDFVNSVKPMVEAIRTKAHKYRELGDIFLVVVNSLDLSGTDKTDMLEALFGWEASTGDQNISRIIASQGVITKDHVWDKGRNTNVSAVLLFNELQHSNIASTNFCIYENPWAKYTPPVALRCFPHGIVQGNYLKWYQGRSLGSLLHLPQGWPSP